MAKIIVSGNKESFQLTKKFAETKIILSGDFSYKSSSFIRFYYDNRITKFKNRNDVLNLAQESLGVNLDRFINLFKKYGITDEFVSNFYNKNAIELNLLKSIFLIYNWIELPLSAPDEINVKPQLYNDFVADWANQIGPQKDIYFIKEEYNSPSNSLILEKLVQLNLLSKLELIINSIIYVNFFIPLDKPGVSRESFKSPGDESGDRAYSFWKKILKDRDIRISNWVNNRF